MRLEVQHYFDAGHQLSDSDLLVTKACANLHGHTYKVKVLAESELNSAGMVVDFKAIKQIIDRLDHRFINDVFKEYNLDFEATSENISIAIYNWLKEELKINIVSVAVAEGYKGEDKASWSIYEPQQR